MFIKDVHTNTFCYGLYHIIYINIYIYKDDDCKDDSDVAHQLFQLLKAPHSVFTCMDLK